MKKFLVALLASVAVIFGMGATASAYPPGGSQTITPSTTTPAPGGTFTASLFGCVPPENVTFTIVGTSISVTVACVGGTSTASGVELAPGTGTATATLTAPTVAGTYTVRGVGATSGVTASTTITVAAAPVTPPPTTGGLPQTGSDATSAMMILGLGIIGVGAGLFGVSQVRRRQTVSV